MLYVAIGVEGGLFLVGYLLLGSSAAEFWNRFKISFQSTGLAMLYCLPMFAGLLFTLRSEWEPILQLREEIYQKILPIFSNSKLIDLAIIAIFAGVGEELFFRGWMQKALIDSTGVLPGILIASLIFGLLHYLSTTYAIYAFITGVYLGIIYFATGNIYIVMAIHALYDFVALVVLVHRREESGSSE